MLSTIVCCCLVVGGVAVAAPWSSVPALATADPGPVAASRTASTGASTGSTASTKEATMLDGFTLGYLPDVLGPMVSDFDYEWGDVSFHTRVWESGPDDEGSHSVDLLAGVLRGGRLTDPAALRDFLADYLEQDPQTWAHQPYERGEYRGFIAPARVFFLVRPGVAVMLSADGPVVDSDELLTTANAIEPATDNSANDS